MQFNFLLRDPLNPAGVPRPTEGDVQRLRSQAEDATLAGTDFSPVGHPLQGMARVANALVGRIKEGQADQMQASMAAGPPIPPVRPQGGASGPGGFFSSLFGLRN